MTISTTVARNDYVGNGSTDTYDFNFEISAASELLVTQRDDDDVEETLVYTTDYTVSGVGDANGGSITLTAGDLPSGYALTIRRVLDLTQETDLRNQEAFFLEVVEDALDRCVAIDQQQQDQLDRAIKFPETFTGNTSISSGGTNKLIGLNSDGNVALFSPTSGSAEDLAIDLLDSDDVLNGDAMVAHYDALAPAYLKTVSDMLNFQPISVLRFIDRAKHAGIRAGTNTDELGALINIAISSIQEDALGGHLDIPSGIYHIEGSASADSKANGIYVPFTSTLDHEKRIKLTGHGTNTILKAVDDNMVVIRWSDSMGFASGLTIKGNSRTGVTGLGIFGPNTAGTVGQTDQQNWNEFDHFFIHGCTEGIELQASAQGGCHHNRLYGFVLYVNTRHLHIRDNTILAGPTSNRGRFEAFSFNGGNTGIEIKAGDTHKFFGMAFEGIDTGTSPNTTPTAIKIALAGATSGYSTTTNQFIGADFENCTRDLDTATRKVMFIGGNVGESGGVVAPSGYISIPGNDDILLPNIVLGADDSGLLLQPRATGFSMRGAIQSSSNQAGSYPFNKDGVVMIQGRQVDTADGDIAIFTGSTSTLRGKVTAGGNWTFSQSAAAPAITTGGTITTAGATIARVAPASAVTGIILQAGTEAGQKLVVINESTTANSITFAAYATSRVADGVTSVIPGYRCAVFYWDTSTNAWYMNAS